MNLLTAIIKAKRPSRIKDMPALVNTFLCRKGFSGITLFGRIFTNEQGIADHLNARNSVMKNHEMIHLRQAQSTHDSWLLFYLLYGWYYLTALPQNLKMRNAAYRLNPFELEAYAHEHDLDYLKHNEATEWRQYAHMSPRERRLKYGHSR